LRGRRLRLRGRAASLVLSPSGCPPEMMTSVFILGFMLLTFLGTDARMSGAVCCAFSSEGQREAVSLSASVVSFGNGWSFSKHDGWAKLSL
jgi:hypothetical protein